MRIEEMKESSKGERELVWVVLLRVAIVPHLALLLGGVQLSSPGKSAMANFGVCFLGSSLGNSRQGERGQVGGRQRRRGEG